MPEKVQKQLGLLGRVFSRKNTPPPISESSPEFPSAAKLKDYDLLKLLGKGKEGRVLEAIHRPTKIHVAVKEISKPRSLFGGPGDPKKELEIRKSIQNEIELMKRLHHPHIIRMYDHFETKDKHYLVFEMATGGELHERIAERGHFNERDAAIIMATLINAIGFLHKHGVVHRDIKSANVLFRTPSHTSDICLVDFGISRALEEGQKLTDLTGTLAYIAPEILTQRGYGATVDMWAAGVMTYELVSGYQPFHSIDSQEDLFDRILRADFDFPDEWFGQVSDECKDFIKKLIHTNPRTRYTAAQCLEHSWFLRFVPPDYLSILSEINEAAERIKQGLDSPHRIEYHDRKSPGVALDPEEARVLDLMGELLDEEEGKGTHRRVKTFAVTGSDTAIAKAKYGGVLPGVLDVGSLLGGLEGKNLPNLHLKLTRAGGRRRHSISVADVSRKLHVEHELSPFDLAAEISLDYPGVAPAISPSDDHSSPSSPLAESQVVPVNTRALQGDPNSPDQSSNHHSFTRSATHPNDAASSVSDSASSQTEAPNLVTVAMHTPRPRRLSFDVALYEHRKEINADPVFVEDAKQEVKDDVVEGLVEQLADFVRPPSRGLVSSASPTLPSGVDGISVMSPVVQPAGRTTPPHRIASPIFLRSLLSSSPSVQRNAAITLKNAFDLKGTPSPPPGSHRMSSMSPSWVHVPDPGGHLSQDAKAHLMIAELAAKDKTGELLGTSEEFEARVARVKERVQQMVQDAVKST